MHDYRVEKHLLNTSSLYLYAKKGYLSLTKFIYILMSYKNCLNEMIL